MTDDVEPADEDEIVLTSETIEYVDEEPAPPESEFVYFRKASALQMSWWCLAGGIAALVFAAFGFAVALIGRVGQFVLQIMVTGPTLIGLALLAASRLMARTPSQVTVGPDGICIDHDRQPREKFAWTDIAWATVGNAGLTQQRQLILYDAQGKTLASFGDAFEDFNRLIKQVQRAVARRDDGAADIVRRKKARTSAVVTGGVALLLTFVAVANYWMASESARTAALLESDAIPGEAEIVRRFVAPNGVTKRLEYRVTGGKGDTATRNAEVTNRYWRSLESATTVPVRYVPAEPAVSRLVEGEVVSDDLSESPGMMQGLSLVLGALCIVFFVAAILQWYGWDIDLDSSSGKVSIKRFG
jgi:hypothetical protein